MLDDQNTAPEEQSILLNHIYTNLKRMALNDDFSFAENIDHTCRNAVGKLIFEAIAMDGIKFKSLTYLRISCQPYSVKTRNLHENEDKFEQVFYLPVNNHFNTLKIELMVQVQAGWFSDSRKDVAVISWEIRVPDIEYEPFDLDGTIKLPIALSEADLKKYGAKLAGAEARDKEKAE